MDKNEEKVKENITSFEVKKNEIKYDEKWAFHEVQTLIFQHLTGYKQTSYFFFDTNQTEINTSIDMYGTLVILV